jgi:hypothetical protein
MAVLVEAISVILRRDRVATSYPGGWDAFEAKFSYETACADDHLARIGFMSPKDVETFVELLAPFGLSYVVNGKAADVVVVDQIRGPLVPCDWIEFGHVELSGNRIAACRLVGDGDNAIFTPANWHYEGSLSQTFGFVPDGAEDRSLRFLRHEDGVDVYMNLLTGKEVFVGRTLG